MACNDNDSDAYFCLHSLYWMFSLFNNKVCLHAKNRLYVVHADHEFFFFEIQCTYVMEIDF